MNANWTGLLHYAMELILIGVLLFVLLVAYRKFNDLQVDRDDVRQYLQGVGLYIVCAIVGHALWTMAKATLLSLHR